MSPAEEDVTTPLPEVPTAESPTAEEVTVPESADAAADLVVGDVTTASAGEFRE